ncbi:hypothetical protein FB479_102431 [Brevibacillus sp. AG162]|nr:hypothetical protein FB479_102431 [Brevibacillus sp. AG162]
MGERSEFPVYASAYALMMEGTVRSEMNGGSASKVEGLKRYLQRLKLKTPAIHSSAKLGSTGARTGNKQK